MLIFTIAFLSEDNYFLRCKVHSVRQYLFNFYLTKIKCKRPEMNSEPTHFLTFINNGKAFSSLDGMACSYQCSDQFQFLPGHWPAKRYWILKKPNLKIILITPVELIVPILNKIIRNRCTDFVVIMSNRLKMISVRGAPL